MVLGWGVSISLCEWNKATELKPYSSPSPICEEYLDEPAIVEDPGCSRRFCPGS